MKKTLLAAMLLSVFAVAGAHAQLTYDAGVSFVQPTGDFGDSAFEPGFGIGGDVFYSLPALPNLGVGGRLAWNRFGVDDSVADGGNMSIIEILPSARYSFTPADSQFGFFGQAGVGLYHWSSTIETVIGDVEDDGNDFGFAFGAGATGKFSDTMSFMLMPMYHIISTEDTSTTYFSLSFGIMF
ncbi:MAG: outer membrane beta-barrel protein [Candidatus Latescibacterota bacterium]